MSREKRTPLMWTAERIRELRTRLGRTQEQFAAELRISVGRLRDWEYGRTAPDGPATLVLESWERDLDQGKVRELQEA